jgi:uncharacterized hydrophobic protein (TIGR00271 family)
MAARQVQVVLPYSKDKDKARTKKIIHTVRGLPFVYGLSIFEGKREKLVVFRVTPKATGKCFYALQSLGVGRDFGQVDIVALHITVPRINVRKKPLRKRLQITDRYSVEEICRMVEAQNVFTFDYLVFVLSAAVIACLGLTTNSGAVVVAAMLISPLMGPIVAVALGLAIQEWSMVRRGFINELAGTLLVLLTGFFWGLGTSDFPGLWETDEQESRGTYWASVAGIGIAIPSGVAVGVAIAGGGASSPIVGVAISASLLPPIANAGMHFAQALMLRLTEQTSANDWETSCRIGGYSLLLFGTNFVCIVFSALLLFRVKGVKRRRVDVSALVKQAEEKPRTEEDLNMSADNRSTFCDEHDRYCTEEEEDEEEHGHLAVEGPGATSSGDVETVTLTTNPFNDDGDDP